MKYPASTSGISRCLASRQREIPETRTTLYMLKDLPERLETLCYQDMNEIKKLKDGGIVAGDTVCRHVINYLDFWSVA